MRVLNHSDIKKWITYKLFHRRDCEAATIETYEDSLAKWSNVDAIEWIKQ